MTRALFPGSFDPLTLGHLDLVLRSLTFVDELYVALMYNPEKSGFLPVEFREELLLNAFATHLPKGKHVQVIKWNGLLADCAREHDLRLVVRGVRGILDLENERAMALANAQLLPGLETIFLPASQDKGGVSSTLVRQIIAMQGDYRPFVPSSVAEDLRQRLNLSY